MDSSQNPNLCGILNSIIGKPIVDATGFSGKYDVTFTFGSDSATGESPAPPQPDGSIVPTADAGLTVFGALEQQLGLKLERRKVAIDAFAIDRVETQPTEN